MRARNRRQREVLHRREDILKAAARAFARSGFDAATMQDIAEEAGYTVPSLYAYFESKQDIVDGLLQLLGEELLRTFEDPAPQDLLFPYKLASLLRRQAEFGDRWREAFAVIFELKSGVGKHGKGRLPSADFFVDRLAVWIRDNARPEDIGGREPEDVAYLLKGVLHAQFVQWRRAGAPGLLADRADAAVDFFLHGLRGGPRAKTEAG